MWREITLLISLILLFLELPGQTLVEGSVKDASDEPVIGANVYLRDSYDGTSTLTDGSFSFTATDSGRVQLLVSYLGYRTYEKELYATGEPIRLDVRLDPQGSELGTVVITAGSFEASDEKKSVVLKPLDIVLTAGATADIAGALNTLPGTQTVGEQGRLFVRGGAAYETRTFIDGLYVQDPYSATVPDLPARGRFSPFLFRGTTFSTGGYSAEYGQALSSALLLETQNLPPNTVTALSLMSVGLGAAHTQRWENTSLAVSADYTDLAPYISLVPQRIDWKRAPRVMGGQLIFRRRTSKTGMLKLQSSNSNSRLSMLYPDPQEVTRRQKLQLDNNNHYVNASYTEVLNDRWSLFTGAAYTINEDLIEQGFRLDAQKRSLHSRIRLGYRPSEKIGLRFGGEFLSASFSERYQEQAGQIFDTWLDEQFWAAFAESDLQISKKLVARIGARLERSGLLKAWNLAPRLSMAFQTGANSQISMAFGQFYQTPAFELLRYGNQPGFEKASHYIINYQLAKDKRTFRIEGYYKIYNQLMRFDPGQPWISDNLGNGYARGLDVFYRDRKSIRNGDFWLSYSFLDTERQYRGFPAPATPAFASRHNLSLVYKHWIPKITSMVGFTNTYASPRPFNDPNMPEFNAGRTPSYNDFSFNASYLTNLFGHFSILYVSVTNLLGTQQSFGNRYSEQANEMGEFSSITVRPPAKRFFFAGLFISFGESFRNNSYNQ